jgi:hypothetical protein
MAGGRVSLARDDSASSFGCHATATPLADPIQWTFWII